MRIHRILAAWLALMLLLAAMPAALTEDAAPAPDEAFDAETLDGAPVDDAPEADGDWAVEEEVPLADDAGDTGLTIDYGDAPEAASERELSLEEAAANEDEAVQAPDAGPEDGEALEILALPEIDPGYVAVAPEAPVYADAARTQAIGVFPDGAVVYAEPAAEDGALLRIRFDTEDSRGWNGELLSGYVLTSDVLACTEAETAALVEALAADARTRYADGVAMPCATFAAIDCAVLAGESGVGLNVAARTQDEIQAFVNAHPAYRNQLNLYSVAAKDAPYSPGKLSPVNQQSALNLLNQLRFIAGLDGNVSLFTEQEDAMAATALVLRLYSEQYKSQNGKDILTHYPGRAAAIADAAYDALYSAGYAGAGRSNIAMGYTVTGALLAYMSDSDANNIATVGHRRWILNPTMGRTVFGANGRFSAMYAHDLTGAGGQSKVAWPAQEMPYQYFNPSDPWSLSYGRALTADKISVTLVRVRDGKVWNFSAASADGDFTVENSAYGQRGCVIFRPSGLDSFAVGEVFNVSVTDGAAGETTRYTVRFFSLNLDACDPLALPETVTAHKTYTGNELGWSTVPGAQGYYVCRRSNADSYYEIVADVTGTAWRDTAVNLDLDYYYQVYAHDACRTSRSAVSVQAKPVPPESVSLGTSGTVTVYRNATLQLSAGFAPANAMAKLTWKSSKTKYATVDQNGLVTPVRKGTSIISVVTDNGKQASVKVKVLNPPKAKKVTLSASGTVILKVGETLQLSGTVEPAEAEQHLNWYTSKKRVASVSGAGMVMALARGTATITARSTSGKKARLKVQVIDPSIPESVALNYKGTVTLKAGQTLQLAATVFPDTAQTALTWVSSRKRVAAVDAGGLVTALKPGSATITVKTDNGKKARMKVKVVR